MSIQGPTCLGESLGIKQGPNVTQEVFWLIFMNPAGEHF